MPPGRRAPWRAQSRSLAPRRARVPRRSSHRPGSRCAGAGLYSSRVHELVHLIAQYGLALVFLNVLVEQICLPVPAVPTLIVAGALSADGKLSAAAVFGVAFLACFIGDGLWYAAGRIYGRRVMRLLCRISLSPDTCVRQSEDHFERWGRLTLVLSKFIPGLSTVAPPLAGAMRLGLPAF